MDIDNLKITDEEYQRLMANREACRFLKSVEEGVFYPIPKLVGADRKILVDQDTMGAQDLTVGYSVFRPGDWHEKHAHAECEEIMYCLSGKMVVGVGDDDEETIQGAGDILFVPRGGIHWAYNPFDEPQIHIFVYTRPSLASAGYSLESEGYEEIGKKVEVGQGIR